MKKTPKSVISIRLSETMRKTVNLHQGKTFTEKLETIIKGYTRTEADIKNRIKTLEKREAELIASNNELLKILDGLRIIERHVRDAEAEVIRRNNRHMSGKMSGSIDMETLYGLINGVSD